MLLTHAPAVLHVEPFTAAHVEVVALHTLVVQTARAFGVVHVPLWRPSFGIAVPAASFAVHV